jgi:hypothetical protein
LKYAFIVSSKLKNIVSNITTNKNLNGQISVRFFDSFSLKEKNSGF